MICDELKIDLIEIVVSSLTTINYSNMQT